MIYDHNSIDEKTLKMNQLAAWLLFLVSSQVVVVSAFVRIEVPSIPQGAGRGVGRFVCEGSVCPGCTTTTTTTTTQRHLFGRSNNDEHSGGGELLINAGKELLAASESVGPKHYACPRLLQDAGEALMEIGECWTSNWEAVTYAAEEAAYSFHALAQLQKHSELQELYGGSSGEFKQIASIVGCTSVGPPSAAPNLENLSRNLKRAARFAEKAGAFQDSKSFSKALRNASKYIQDLANEYN